MADTHVNICIKANVNHETHNHQTQVAELKNNNKIK